MNIDVIASQDKSEYYFSQIPLVNIIHTSCVSVSSIVYLIKGVGPGDWLANAIKQSKAEFINDESKLIAEVEKELIKAKKLMKERYPIRYKLSYYKVMLKNPIKTIIAKCLLK